ncbi:3-oxoadipyl-CoA thiolase [Amphritea balenae]|uniref:Beta-ketoadipyl-CoA thiolase n=1 Tax=Amphritea balenae TaxID=452629 RepID=A0A3P1SLP1_9GAMM|nr:3-oxoadipyl-CoA thiolase [Amphritea balenae]RRC98058.1 3-oxoadipyl-CoA thiolase [Amphritea balenae]GGK67188.1 acetyl-CoA acetyltransferase [Amphritea balenae]
MQDAYICDAIRTPIGRYGGSLASVRTDDLGAIPIKALMQRNHQVDWQMVDDLVYGCANQAGEDNRNVGRMVGLLAGLPTTVAGVTLNRLCGSGMDAVSMASRSIKAGEAQLMIAGGVESMSRAPFVMPKAQGAFSRQAEIYDTTIGWRFINPSIKSLYGVDSMPETAENLANEFSIARHDQDVFALRSQHSAAKAQAAGLYADEIVPVNIPQRKGDPVVVGHDEHLRPQVTLESLAKLKGVVSASGSVTAGNASGVNDGACALLLSSEAGLKQHQLTPRARVVASASAGVDPRVMGFGPVPAVHKVLAMSGLELDQMDLIELNEAFAAQALSVIRNLGLADDDARVNPLGGAIALGHPLGMSGARLITTAMYQLQRSGGRYALCTMCVGVGQGVAMIIERL